MRLFGSKKDKDKEKRRHSRHEIYQATYYMLDDKERNVKECLIHNISLGGMMIEAKEELPEGTMIVVIVNLGGKILQEKLRVLRKTMFITPHYGCTFVDPDGEEKRQKQLHQFLENLD